MARLMASIVLVTGVVLGSWCGEGVAQSAPEGQLTIAFDTTIAPTFLDPAETPGIATPFAFLYAMHDALMKPLPGNNMAPCLAESFKESADGLAYEFKLREGLRFHNGDPFTAEDVKLSGVIVTVTAAPGNAASRIEAFVISSAPYASGGYPDIDELFRQQAQERDRKKREVVLHQIQRVMHERVMFGGIFEPATLHGVGPRVEEPAIGLSAQLYFAAPYEDMRLKRP